MRRDAGPPDASALSWLPFIGAIVGAIGGAAGYALFVLFHVPWANAFALIVAIALTGAVHVDGFLDTCDGLLASAPPDRRLEIMKDPRHGTFAIAGFAALVVLWLYAITAVTPARLPLVLAWSGSLARLAVIPCASIFPYARDGAMSVTFAQRPSVLALIAGFAMVEGLAWFVAPWTLAVAPVALAIAWIGGAWSARRLGGGLTGDVYGALIVKIEMLALLALSIARS